MAQSTAALQERTRQIVYRTRGHRYGPITRLMSPSDLGRTLKPFVFLDLFDSDGGSFSGFGWHPHSGIATLTYLWEGSVRCEDTTGAAGFLPAGGVEWFKAARGAWHGGGAVNSGRSRGFQLWLALPPDQELGPVESIYQKPQDIHAKGPASVLRGTLGGVSSPLEAPSSINYLALRLRAGETWRYEPPTGHTICWIALASGRLVVPEPAEAGELVVFEPSNETIDFRAEADTEHTSPTSLQAGERRLAEIKVQLQRKAYCSVDTEKALSASRDARRAKMHQ